MSHKRVCQPPHSRTKRRGQLQADGRRRGWEAGPSLASVVFPWDLEMTWEYKLGSLGICLHEGPVISQETPTWSRVMLPSEERVILSTP